MAQQQNVLVPTEAPSTGSEGLPSTSAAELSAAIQMLTQATQALTTVATEMGRVIQNPPLNLPKAEEVKPRQIGVTVAAQAVKIDGLDKFFDMISKGLGERAWMVGEFVTSPFLVRADLPRVSVTELADYLFEKEVLCDISAFVNTRVEELSEIVFLGLYPSGAVRGITGFVHKEGNNFLVRLEDPTCLLDPDSLMLPDAFRELTYEVSLVGLKVPSYV